MTYLSNLIYTSLERSPARFGIISSASSGSLYFVQVLTDDLYLKIAAGLGVFLGVILTVLGIVLTSMKIYRASRYNKFD